MPNLLAALCLAALTSKLCQSEHTEILAELPNQPMIFNTPDELRTYLQELDKYFAIAGRPRFGRTLGNGFGRPMYQLYRANPIPPAF